MRIWPVVAEMVGSHGSCALVTVAAVRGSAPREPGARMVIAPDGGFRGAIGGGELEWRAIGAARDALSRNTPAATLSRFILGPDLGQCCGGSVQLLTEVFDRDRQPLADPRTPLAAPITDTIPARLSQGCRHPEPQGLG